jgi:hypothetical protein
MTDLYAAALALADRGIPVFPCSASKAPAVADGFKAATLCPEPAEWRGASLIGSPTGDLSGYDVIDVDPRHGGDRWLAEHAERLPITRTVRTRSGGWHIYLRAWPGMRCSAGKIAPGVDVRAAGGYVIRWDAHGQPVTHDDAVADWPTWLADSAAGSRVRHAEDPERSVADIAPPSADAVVSLLDRMPNPAETSRDTYLSVMMAARGCTDGVDDVGAEDIAEAAIGWACRWSGSPGYDVEAAKWADDFALRDRPIAGWPQLVSLATRLGVDTAEIRAEAAAADFEGVVLPAPPVAIAHAKRMRDRLLRPADCETGPRRGYLIKGLLAPGDVGALVGQPGCGKSHLAPLLAYAVAQGRDVFGCRTKPGGALYVAAEDFSGMRQRVHALKLAHGDAPAFALVDCGNLADAAELADLLDTVAHERPALVIIDTVGAAWAGLEENDAAGMGAVVALARRIGATGAAVLLVHHVAKNGDGTPRGHSILYGTLDMCLTLAAMDEHRVIRGKLTKNRNGPCDLDIAFRSDATVLGVDEDGDAITAPIATALAANLAPQRPKLSEREAQALAILADLATGDEGVSEESWFAACDNARVSTSETARNRRTAIGRIVRNLIENGSVAACDGRYRLIRVSATGHKNGSVASVFVTS